MSSRMFLLAVVAVVLVASTGADYDGIDYAAYEEFVFDADLQKLKDGVFKTLKAPCKTATDLWINEERKVSSMKDLCQAFKDSTPTKRGMTVCNKDDNEKLKKGICGDEASQKKSSAAGGALESGAVTILAVLIPSLVMSVLICNTPAN